MIDRFLILATAGTFVLGQLGRIALINGYATVYVYEILMVAHLLWMVVRMGGGPIVAALRRPWLSTPLGLAVFSYGLSLGNFTAFQNLVAGLYFVRILLYLGYGLYLSAWTERSDKAGALIGRVLMTVSWVVAISGLVQYAVVKDLWFLYTRNWDPHSYRTFGTFLDVSVSAALYGFFLFRLVAEKGRVWGAGRVVHMIVLVACLILSFSRNAYAATAVTGVILAVWRARTDPRSLLWGGVIGLVMVLLVAAAPKPFGEGVNLLRTVSIRARMADMERAITLWQKAPVFGHGYNRIRFVRERYLKAPIASGSHAISSFPNSYLILLVTGGLVGLVATTVSMGWVMRGWGVMGSVPLLYVLVMSAGDNVILHPHILLVVMVYGALMQSAPVALGKGKKGNARRATDQTNKK